MNTFELVVVALSVSADAFAVALSRGLRMKRFEWRQALIIAIFFGGFQMLMPLIGWFLGSQIEQSIIDFAPWIAFLLLLLIGLNMIRESIADKDSSEGDASGESRLRLRELTLLSVATSVDALAVGVSFSLLTVAIIPAVTLIGISTFVLSLLAVAIGRRVGARFGNIAEILGGVVLIIIGARILLVHLGVL